MKPGRALKLTVALGAAFAIGLVAAVKAIDLKAYKLQIAQRVEALTGRDLAIAGPLELRPGLPPMLVARGVTLSNPPGASRADMIKVARVEAEVALLPLLKREIRVRRLTFVAPDILLEGSGRGGGNWHFTSAPDAPQGRIATTRFDLSEVRIKNGRLAWRDAATGAGDSVNLHKVSVQPQQTGAAGLNLRVVGDHLSRDFEITGRLGTVEQAEGGKPWPLQLNAAMAGMKASAQGTVLAPLAGSGFDLKLSAQGDDFAEVLRQLGFDEAIRRGAGGPFRFAARLGDGDGRPGLSEIDAAFGRRDQGLVSAKGVVRDLPAGAGIELALTYESDGLAALSPLAGLALPATAPLKAAATLRGGGGAWTLADLKAGLGGSDLAGTLDIDLNGAKPRLRGQLTSAVLVPADILAPRPGDRPERRPLPSGAVLPEATLSLQVGRLPLGAATLSDLAADIRVGPGRIALSPVRAVLAGGTIRGGATMETAASGVSARLAVTGGGIDFGRLLREAGSEAVEGGAFEFRLQAGGSGADLASALAAASGQGWLGVTEAKVAAGDGGTEPGRTVLAALAPLAGEDGIAVLDCAGLRFALKEGIADAGSGIAAEGPMGALSGGARFDLRAGTLALDLAAAPRRPGAASGCRALSRDLPGR
ncbi:AsmA family protein [Magnetospirillum sp. UT-4]|uniref:AsmA family protein n=1 Tax=Magnetospirillum sp. UT-4 TaxID=2681467 RepID=UPI0013845639|nr:AsmA family protein [Magnetospirillum sp. UT-4]CAA7616666.1 putative outer membrane biogenesis protein [Magnetospirillum sp. UT-4]